MAGLIPTALLLFTVAALQPPPAIADDASQDRLQSVLESWVDGARPIERPNIATARARYGQRLSMHQLEAAVFLWTPESVDSLNSRFDWSLITGTDGSIRLAGDPISEVDRAFIGAVEVHWNAESRRPTSIQFAEARVRFANVPRVAGSTLHQAAYYPPAEGDAADVAADDSEVNTASAVLIDAGDSAHDETRRILERWEAAGSNGQPWELRVNSCGINHVFASEQRHYVLIRGDGQGTIEIRQDPQIVEPGAVNPQRLAADGTPYRLQTGSAPAWIFTPEFAIFADLSSLTLRRVASSAFDEYPWYRRPRQTPSCMTFFLPVTAEDLLAHYQWEIESHDDSAIRLRGVPGDSDVAASISLVEVELNAATCLPQVVRCVDARGNHEQQMQVIERATPVGLTAELILEGYASFSPAPEKP